VDSLNLNFEAMIGTAFQLINGLWPVFTIPVAFTLGLGLLGWIVYEVGKAVQRH
jgi:hypothetical protein